MSRFTDSKFTEVWQDRIVENTHEYKKGREGYEYANSWKDVKVNELATKKHRFRTWEVCRAKKRWIVME